MKRIGKAIASVSLALALLAPASIHAAAPNSLPAPANEVESSKKEDDEREKYKSIHGEIINIRKGSFQILYRTRRGDESQLCTAEFRYEILYINDSRDYYSSKKILVPYPTTFEVEEYVRITYKPIERITFSELAERYAKDIKFMASYVEDYITNHMAIQDGVLEIDGILETPNIKDKKE